MGNAEKSYILAMYDVRGKQKFIYQGRKCKEIIGASHIIADVFKDYLYPAAKEYMGIDKKQVGGIYDYQQVENDTFSVEKFEERMKGNEYIGEVVYEGGGNFLVLYKDKETCIEVNKRFTKELLKSVGTLRVLCTYVDKLDFEGFENDRRRLYEAHRINEAQESVIYPVNTLPFTYTSPSTGRPFTAIAKKVGNKQEHVSTEERAKYEKYEKVKKESKYDQEGYLLDEMVDKGNESLLAVIYIDGNNMGAKVKDHLENKKPSYNECVNELRKFSKEINENYVDNRINAINNALSEKHEDDKQKVRRTIVAAGDEMTIICNARDALDVVRAYFKEFPAGNSSCAGIAIFHSHAPYSDAYRIAEECCENAKSMMKEAGVPEVNLMDFHYCQGGIGISLEHIRERENLEELMSKPWKICCEAENFELSPVFKAEDIESDKYRNMVYILVDSLRHLGHSNVKILRQAAQSGEADLGMELSRIKAHNLKYASDFIFGDLLSESQKRKLIYDAVIMYDLWFQKGEEA